jgi:hypothetical protein
LKQYVKRFSARFGDKTEIYAKEKLFLFFGDDAIVVTDIPVNCHGTGTG